MEVAESKTDDDSVSDFENLSQDSTVGRRDPLEVDVSENLSKEVTTKYVENHEHKEHRKTKSWDRNNGDAIISEVFNESVENIMKFAEILYKCTLCTSLPSILTSKDSFISHINEHHFTKSKLSKECSFCNLTFGTDEDLTAHLEIAHSGKQEDCRSIKSTSSESFEADEIQKEKVILGIKLQKLKQRNPNKAGEGDMDKDPKYIIVHGQENLSQVSNGEENLSRLHELTDEIMAVQAKEKRSQSGDRGTVFGVPMLPSYTAEFGKFTKLVREGGNIVYFCQVCNWKSQVKVQFQGHCQSSSHLMKVKHAAQKNGDRVPVDNVNCEPQGGGDATKVSDYKSCTTSSLTVNFPSTKEKPESPLGLYKDNENRMITDSYSSLHLHHSDDNDSDITRASKLMSEKSSKGTVRHHNKRKPFSATTIRNHIYDADRWETSDSDENFASPNDSSTSPMKSVQGKRRFVDASPTPSENEISVGRIKRERSRSPAGPSNISPKHKAFDSMDSAIRQTEKLCSQFFPFLASPHQMLPKSNGSVFPEFFPQPPFPQNKMSQQLPFTPLRQKESSEYHNVENLSRLQREPCLNFSEQNSQILRESKSVYSTSDSLASKAQRSYFPNTSTINNADLSRFMYRCSLCMFGCDDIVEYKNHFEMEHEQFHDDQGEQSAVEGKGESWKMLKIKEALPDLICSFPRGNVSRDLLLQKISQSLNFPEVLQWGPACNKAVRELFPVSLAQRKGKYKKTYFFGVSFIEQLQEPEEPQISDGEVVQYQPLRDMSQDMEKILEHLHVLVEWKGDMSYGISRDEVLQLLHQRIDEPDVQHWGMQCNRAIRYLFPHVQMKRKGKYKTTIFFGVDFKTAVQDLLKNSPELQISPVRRGRPKKPLGCDLVLTKPLSWTDAIRTGHSDAYKLYSNIHVPSSAHTSSDAPMATRAWGPSMGWLNDSKVDHAEQSSENLESPPKDLTMRKQKSFWHRNSAESEQYGERTDFVGEFEGRDHEKREETRDVEDMNCKRTTEDSREDGIDPKFLYKYGPWCEPDEEAPESDNRTAMFVVTKNDTDDDLDDDADDEGSDAEDEVQTKDTNEADLNEFQSQVERNLQLETKEQGQVKNVGCKTVPDGSVYIKVENESY